MAEKPGPHGRVRERLEGAGDRGRKAAQGRVHGQERRNCHGANGGGICGGGTQIDTAEAADVYYPGFFQQMAGLGARVSVG